MTQKHKRSAQPNRLNPFSPAPVSFEFPTGFSVEECAAYLKKLNVTHPPTEVVLFMVEPDAQRFHIATRVFRSHLVDLQGYLRQEAPNRTLVSGDAHTDNLALPVLALILVATLFFGLLSGGNLLLILVGLMAVGLALIYFRQAMQRGEEDVRASIDLIEDTLNPISGSSP